MTDPTNKADATEGAPMPEEETPKETPEQPVIPPELTSDRPLTMDELAPFFENQPSSMGAMARELAVCRYRLAAAVEIIRRFSAEKAAREAVQANRTQRREAARSTRQSGRITSSKKK